VKCWVNSVDDPPLWFGYNNMGQMLEPIKSPSQSDVTGRQGEPAEETVDEESRQLIVILSLLSMIAWQC
jgi:hypothetical protein